MQEPVPYHVALSAARYRHDAGLLAPLCASLRDINGYDDGEVQSLPSWWVASATAGCLGLSRAGGKVAGESAGALRIAGKACNIFMNVMLTTQMPTEKKAELHEQYIDIQLLANRRRAYCVWDVRCRSPVRRCTLKRDYQLCSHQIVDEQTITLRGCLLCLLGNRINRDVQWVSRMTSRKW